MFQETVIFTLAAVRTRNLMKTIVLVYKVLRKIFRHKKEEVIEEDDEMDET
jgi:hypothetical protein